MNKDLDDQIASLNSEISKAKHNANYQDDDIKRKIMTVHEQKKTIDTLRIKQKDTTIQLEKVKLRNDNCEGDCKRYSAFKTTKKLKNWKKKMIFLAENYSENGIFRIITELGSTSVVERTVQPANQGDGR